MKEDKLMGHDPLSDTDAILSTEYYGRPSAEPADPAGASDGGAEAGRKRRARASSEPGGKERPTHYKVICISMYTRDIEELEAKVAELKRRGWTKASKSHLIRLALSQVDLDKLPTPRQ